MTLVQNNSNKDEQGFFGPLVVRKKVMGWKKGGAYIIIHSKWKDHDVVVFCPTLKESFETEAKSVFLNMPSRWKGFAVIARLSDVY